MKKLEYVDIGFFIGLKVLKDLLILKEIFAAINVRI